MDETDLTAHILHALANAGVDFVTHVEEWMGWGEIQNVVVHVALERRDASPALSSIIHDVIGSVLERRRHYVEIRWLES